MLSERKLSSDDADLCGIAELGDELLTVVPREPECEYVSEADTAYNVVNG